MPNTPSNSTPDVILVGGGIMSATLAILMKELQPDLTMEIFESLDAIAAESSNAWNNAGTGHAALCELNYTPQKKDGSVNTKKAQEINEAFEVSKQFWSHLVKRGVVENPQDFIRQVPHMSFVKGAADVKFLRARYTALKQSHLFADMEYSEDPKQLEEWMPLVMEGRLQDEPVAATYVKGGTDVNFGALTRSIISYLGKQPGCAVHLRHRVEDVKREGTGWTLVVKDKATRKEREVTAKFVFLGAGGGALPLLQKSGIPEVKGFGGFPVSGQWLRCDVPELVDRHFAKVYGKAAVGAPPMSVPHLDTRVIDGKRSLLFGPFAGITWKFLKTGSLLDLPLSLKPDNLRSMLSVGRDNLDLTGYLIGQALQTQGKRLEALSEFLPNVNRKDWKLQIAGQRVQIIKYHDDRGGVLQFGTEVVSSSDGTIAALLGASPGASTSVSIMLDLLNNCFKSNMKGAAWKEKLKTMIPSYGESLAKDASLYQRLQADSTKSLKLG